MVGRLAINTWTIRSEVVHFSSVNFHLLFTIMFLSMILAGNRTSLVLFILTLFFITIFEKNLRKYFLVFFGIVFLIMWELLVLALSINPILLPPPSAIGVKFITEIPTLWIDFTQTLIKGALSGYLLGCGSAFILAILIDRFDFLKRGLLPLGNFVSALPIVGMAPIFVMWFGFDWESKCAVVVAMVFFPMLVNTVQGLSLIDHSRQDLMHTYRKRNKTFLIHMRRSKVQSFVILFLLGFYFLHKMCIKNFLGSAGPPYPGGVSKLKVIYIIFII